VDEALSLIPKDHDKAYRALKDLAEHFASSDREKAMRFASEAILHARSEDDPARTFDLAEVGAFLVRLGNKEVGEKLVREAGDLGAKWASSDQRDWQIGTLAVSVAKVNVALALKLAEKIKKERRSSCVAHIALALDDLPKAESLLKAVEPWYAGRARACLAYRIAATRPAEAVRLVENTPADSGREELTKAAAFGWLATVIAPKDPAMAHSLIDRAFAIYLHPSEQVRHFGGWWVPQSSLLAFHARLAGYPDMDSVIYRVLAMRQTTKDSWSPAGATESSVAIALFLALVDRALAKQMLQSLEVNSDAIGSGGTGVGSRDWLRAWALVDPPHSVALFERELAAAKDDNAKRSACYAALEMVEFWTTDPSNVVKLVTRGSGNIFSPDQEYW
jgi:hypothetical protein